MAVQVYCPSPEEANEELLVRAHDTLCADLNAMAGGRCLYVGDRRAVMLRLKQEIEQAMNTGGEIPRLMNRVYCATHGRMWV